MCSLRIGHGYDVHRLVSGRPLILGGVAVEHKMGLLGHSDADVCLHAIMDAILGALALGDIGRHFPDTDMRFKGSKAEIIRLGVSLGVDYSLTTSCYDPDSEGRSCGKCDSCRLRHQGFADAGVPDPTRYTE